IDLGVPELYAVVDANGQLLAMSHPRFDMSIFQQSLQKALQGQEVQGNLQVSSDRNNSLAGLYVSIPIRYGGQSNGAIIGALVVAEPLQYPTGFSPYEFLAKVDKAILITGSVIAIVVIIFSLWLARRLTRPLTSLTLAAEQMGEGNYDQRVVIPKGNDELGSLALSFNSMAEKIESDVTELHRQDQVRRDLIANIAHDLATPLTAIQGFSEALADDVITDPQARQDTAQLIGREVQRLRRLVSDMQQMTSLEAGRIRIDQEPLDLHALVNEVLEVILPECEQVGITLRNEIDPATPAVLADSDRMTQVLLNLLDNAKRYTSSGGSITIGARLNASEAQSRQQQLENDHVRHVQVGQQLVESMPAKQNQASTHIVSNVGVLGTKRSGKLTGNNTTAHSGQLEASKDDQRNWLTVWVKDTGTGIDPKDLPYIFDRFFRADRSRSGASGGSGLGLAIIKAIITAHGGTIRAESTPGKGTCITFTLPLA
ncbi:MAG TPA: HAMP domain-containing sensor histidine kinase, partial [Ktedonobacteraceae bacterium]|nr:HAMP domain-containing sensor histidine kinase [Ktedonobacteraceae bacterium]